MAGRHRHQLVRGFRQRDVEALFAFCDTVEQELQAEGGLAGARRAFDQVETLRGQPAIQNIVETGNTGRNWGLNSAWVVVGGDLIHRFVISIK
jgi:hypothetical protein